MIDEIELNLGIPKKSGYYFTTANNRPREANNESRGGPGTGLCSPGGGFSGRRNGKQLRLLRLKNHPRDYKNQYQDHQDHPGDSLLAPQGRWLAILK